MSIKRKAERSKGKGIPSMYIEVRNAYICTICQHTTITVHIHRGNTPFYISCEECMSTAVSFKYKLPEAIMLPEPYGAGLDATWEFYNPFEGVSPVEIPELTKKLSKTEQEIVEKGELLMRKRTDEKPIKHRI